MKKNYYHLKFILTDLDIDVSHVALAELDHLELAVSKRHFVASAQDSCGVPNFTPRKTLPNYFNDTLKVFCFSAPLPEGKLVISERYFHSRERVELH